MEAACWSMRRHSLERGGVWRYILIRVVSTPCRSTGGGGIKCSEHGRASLLALTTVLFGSSYDHSAGAVATAQPCFSLDYSVL
jgi:hypothetical protein